MIDEIIETFFTSLRKMLPEGILVVGIGNSLKADDGVGPAICSQLKKIIPDNVIDAGTVPENYIQVIINRAPKAVLFIDAIDFGAAAGAIRIFDPCELSEGAISTHALSPRLLSEMITQDISAKIYFIGIQPGSMKMGLPMSHEVESTMKEILKRFNNVFLLNNSV